MVAKNCVKMALLAPKKDGSPNADFFQSPESMQGFEQVRQWLQKNCKKVRIRRVSRHSPIHRTSYIQNYTKTTFQ